MNINCLLLLLLFGLSCIPPLAAEQNQVSMEYRYWDWGRTPYRDTYQFELLNLALKKTTDVYGPYKTHRVIEYYSALRARREVNRGTVVNMQPGPWRDVGAMTKERVLRLDIPLVSLLGFRQLIIRKEDIPRFNSISTEDEFKKLVLGQGQDWVDVDIYEYNNYKVDHSANLPFMLDMLVHKRFDYVPMSIIEVESVLASRPDLADKITIAPNIIIYYPLPTVFYVSFRNPELKTRLEAGLKIIKNDGSMIQLHQKYFGDKIKFLKQKELTIFVLKNPAIPDNLLGYETDFFNQIIAEDN